MLVDKTSAYDAACGGTMIVDWSAVIPAEDNAVSKSQVSPSLVLLVVCVRSMRLSFIGASSFSESRKRMAGEELSLFTPTSTLR